MAIPDNGASTATDPTACRRSRKRERGFSAALRRERIELLWRRPTRTVPQKTFFTKVKEELSYIPAQLKVWSTGRRKRSSRRRQVIRRCRGATRCGTAPVHPLGKCFAHPTLLAYLITSKYADGLPLYRLEGILKREGHGVSRSVMANWIIRLEDVCGP